MNTLMNFEQVHSFVYSDAGRVLWPAEGESCPICYTPLAGEGLPDEFNAVWCDSCLEHITNWAEMARQCMVLRGQAWYLATLGDSTKVIVAALLKTNKWIAETMDGTFTAKLRSTVGLK